MRVCRALYNRYTPIVQTCLLRSRGTFGAPNHNKFEIAINVQGFNNCNLTVRTDHKSTIIVEGTSREQLIDETNKHLVHKPFKRYYRLPKGCTFQNIKSYVTDKGQLHVKADIERHF